MMTEKQNRIKHEYTDAIVCPYCGHEVTDDLFEYTEEYETPEECPMCEREYIVEVGWTKWFSTRKAEETPDA
jgi:rubrerythrin